MLAKAKDAVAFLQSTLKKYLPDVPFKYQFLDEHFEEIYTADTHLTKIVGVLAILAIIISCLGLFGIAFDSVEKR